MDALSNAYKKKTSSGNDVIIDDDDDIRTSSRIECWNNLLAKGTC